MTVSRVDSSVKYNCNGTTVDFDFEFPIIQSSDLVVTLITTLTGAEVVLVEGTNYAVAASDSGYGGGGTVTTQAMGETEMEDYAYSSAYQILIQRSVPATQLMDLRTGQNLDLQTIEAALDKLQMQVTDMRNQVNLCFQAPTQDADTTPLVITENADQRASKFLGFDENGDIIATDGPITGTIPTSFGEDLVTAEDAEDVLDLLGVDPYMQGLLGSVSNDAELTALIGTASEAGVGTIEVATHAETDEGTDDARAITPHKLYETPGPWRRNLLINGSALIYQRPSITISSSFQIGAADRWLMFFNSSSGSPTGTGTYSTGYGNLTSGRCLAATGIGCTGTNILYFGQRVESYLGTAVSKALTDGKKLSLRFMVYHNIGTTQDITPSISTADATDTFTTTTNRWTGNAVSIPSGVWTEVKVEGFVPTNTNFGYGFVLYLGLSTPASMSGKNVYIGDVQLEIGSKCTPFELRLVTEELELCQRYYQRFVSPAQYYALAHGLTYASTTGWVHRELSPAMRAAPSLSSGGSFYVNYYGSSYTASSLTMALATTHLAVITLTITGTSFSYALGIYLTDSASGGGSWIAFSAEL